MDKQILRLARLAALSCLPLLAGCSGGGGGTASAPASSKPSALPAEFNQEMATLDGGKLTLSQYQGKVVLVNFWATWCDPCRGEIPWFIEFNKKYADKGLVIVGVAMDEDGKKVVAPWIAKQRFDVNGTPSAMDYQIALGSDKIAEKFGGLIGMPTSFLYSRDGKRVKTMIGLVNRQELSKTIESLL
jgi:thiol-disulfide isomerase/thioredoxin